MKLNHLNLTVTDVPGARQFLEKYFALQSLDKGGNSQIAQLRDDNGLDVTLMKVGEADVQYPASFHIGFIQETEEQVNRINQLLRDDGYQVPKPARLHGSWTFYFQAPGGFLVEVLH